MLLNGFYEEEKSKIFHMFISRSYFKVPKTLIPNSKQKRTATNGDKLFVWHWFKDFMKLYKDYTKKSYSVLVNDTTLSSDNLLEFSKNLLDKKRIC